MTKLGDHNLRKIQRIKRSYYVTLPISYVRELGWDKNRDVAVGRDGTRLIIEGEQQGRGKEHKSRRI